MANEYENCILHGDAASELASLPDNSVHLVVTSLPYFEFKDYGSTDGEDLESLNAFVADGDDD